MSDAATAKVDPADSLPMPTRLIRATLAILGEEGPSEIKARRIADRVGVSTVAIYHHFGGLPELLAAVVGEGYTMLRSALIEATTLADDPSAELFAMALAARDMARSNPHLYDMMFGLSTRGTYRAATASDDPPATHFAAALGVLVSACQRLIESGRITEPDAHQVAYELWCLVHGYATLETVGHFRTVDDPVASVLAPMAVRHLVGMGDDPDLARQGASTAMRWWTDRRG